MDHWKNPLHSYDGISGSTGNSGYRGVQHLVYASSSSVYGGNKKVPFSTDDQDGQLEMRYSNAKLDVVKQLLSEAEYNYLRRALTTLSSKNALESVSSIDYLNRYSNNILTVSGLRKVKVDSLRISKDRLYKMYVYKENS